MYKNKPITFQSQMICFSLYKCVTLYLHFVIHTYIQTFSYIFGGKLLTTNTNTLQG